MPRQKMPVKNYDPDAPDYCERITRIDRSNLCFGLDITTDSKTVATWVQTPKVMLQDLEHQFQNILRLCDYGELKSKYIPNVEGIHGTVWRESFWLEIRAKCVALVNSIQLTPFDSQIILRVRTELLRGSSSTFMETLKNYRVALHQLKVWIEAKDLLSGEPNAAVSNGNVITSDLQTEPIPRGTHKKRTIRFNDPTAKIPERFCFDGKPCGPFIGSMTDIFQALQKGKTGRAPKLKKLCDEENAILFVKESGVQDQTLHAYFIKERFMLIAKSWPDSFSDDTKANHHGVFNRR